MADSRKKQEQQKNSREQSPAPLLLVEPGGGLTFTPAGSNSLFMPVPISEPTLVTSFGTDLEGEADSFIGQSSSPTRQVNQSKSMTFTMSQSDDRVDPFAGVGTIQQSSSADSARSQSLQQQQQQYNQPAMLPTGQSSLQTDGIPVYSSMSIPTSDRGPYDTAMQPQSTVTNNPVPPYSSNPPVTDSGRVSGGNASFVSYQSVHPHWYYTKNDKKPSWSPFSLLDSMRLEEIHQELLVGKAVDPVVATDGGRYDVYVHERLRKPVYWDEPDSIVRRSTWFFRGEGESQFTPYEEEFASKLEDEYYSAITTNVWNRRLEFSDGEAVVMHNPNVIVHFKTARTLDEWGAVDFRPTQQSGMHPRVVKRGVEDFESIDDGEPVQIDHLVFMVHGIGSFCDLKFRNIVACVDGFRELALVLTDGHFQQASESKLCGRVEFLPVYWHKALHKGKEGVDKLLKSITLPSISKLRHYTNDTILDALFYTSPKYCQLIVEAVGNEMNRLYDLFTTRNPNFDQTKISVAGHSLGSLIVFDLLAHQGVAQPYSVSELHLSDQASATDANDLEKNFQEKETSEMDSLTTALSSLGLESLHDVLNREQIDLQALLMCSEADLKDLGIPMGPRKKLVAYIHDANEREKSAEVDVKHKQSAPQEHPTHPHLKIGQYASLVNFSPSDMGTGQLSVVYPQLDFNPCAFFALGGPVAVFLTIRGVEDIGENYQLPTCPGFYNIFHPFDPVAYRVEPMINKSFHLKPVLIPHHKGRKRMHLEIKEGMARIGTDIKQKLIETFRSTWHTVAEFARSHSGQQPEELEALQKAAITEVIEGLSQDEDFEIVSETSSIMNEEEVTIGQLNGGRRIDYVLQEKPIESFNDYLFALASHACYWESEDTVLFILKELYTLQGVCADRKISDLFVARLPSAVSSSPYVGISYQTSDKAPEQSVSGYQQTSEPLAAGGMVPTYAGANYKPPPSVQAPTGPVGPPPLSGFVKKS